MVETADETDPRYGIPLFSLYGEVRRPTGQMMSAADVFLFDLQDLGCRIYTFCHHAALPARRSGRARQGSLGARPAQPGGPPGRRHAAGAGAGKLRRRRADADAPRADDGRDGRTGSSSRFRLDVDYRVIEMHDWLPEAAPGLRLAGEPHLDQPEPQRREPQHGARLCRHGHARRHDAERGPGHHAAARSAVRRARCRRRGGAGGDAAPRARTGSPAARSANAGSTPTFHKHAGTLCNALDDPCRRRVLRSPRVPPLAACRRSPSRRSAGSIRTTRSGAIFLTSTSSTGWRSTSSTVAPRLREWVDDPAAEPGDLDARAEPDEASWREEVADLLLY